MISEGYLFFLFIFIHFHGCICKCSDNNISFFFHLTDYLSPTRPPPTIPLKQVGPQAIPAPVNAPNTDIHDIYAYHSVDEFGNPYSEVHEDIRKGPKGLVNPGASLVPHPVALAALHEAPGSHFVGAPTLPLHENVVMHLSGEKETKGQKSSANEADGDSTTTENMPDNVKDDRYQTHFVEVDKDTKGKSLKTYSISHGGLNVGESIGENFNAHHEDNHAPAPNNDAEGAKVEKDREQHREEMRVNSHDEHRNHDHHVTNELHKPQHYDHTYLDLPRHGHLQESGVTLEKQSTIEAQASERSNVVANHNQTDDYNKNGNQRSGEMTSVEEDKKNIKAIGQMLTMFGKATKTLSNKIIRNANKFITSEGKTPYIPQPAQHAINNARSHSDKGKSPAPEPPHKISEVKQLMENLNNLTSKLTSTMLGFANANSLTGVKKDALKTLDDDALKKAEDDDYKQFTDHQKHAYKTWRRQALINFRRRNPDKPIPRNTVSLSDNSLCPKFCRLFCDPWCVKIGCCKLSPEKLNVYKEIEREAAATTLDDKSALKAGNV